ncbi:MAG: DUF6340 family protein [Bacteroidota bacterium]
MNIIKTNSFFLVLIISLAIHGCAGIYSVVEFEVLEPATVSFPNHVGQLLILNRAPVSLNVIGEENRNDLSKEQLVMVDTTVTNSTFRGLLKVLQQSPIDRFHTPMWLSERRADTSSLDDLVLTKREVNTLSDRYGADAVISLELYTVKLDEHQDFYSNAPEIPRTGYYLVSNKMQWNIYLPDSPRAFDTYTTVDTLYFPYLLDGQTQPTPNGLNMIQELFYESGMKYGRYLVPIWTHASRVLYKGKGDSLKRASKYTSQGEWDQAHVIWKDLTESDDSTVASKAYHNLAIYYELEDNLDSASLLLDRALMLDTLEVVRLYREELDIRILNRNEVLQQVR